MLKGKVLQSSTHIQRCRGGINPHSLIPPKILWVNGFRSPSTVNISVISDFHTDSDMVDLVQEMEIMKIIRKHVNVLSMLGCCTQAGPLYVILEYAPHGNLRDFLRMHRPESGYESVIGEISEDSQSLSQKELMSFARQIAKGMEYLASRRVSMKAKVY